MDSVRFGRALGFGARQAAKTLVTAVDAATAPNPASTTGSGRPSTTSRTQPAPAPTQRIGHAAARTVTGVRGATSNLSRGSRRFGEAVWGPVVKLSGVLWLEITGLFFGVFALFAAGGAWKLRDALHRTPANTDQHTHFELALGMTILFGYFCVSSFLRAHRRGRRS